MNNNNPHLIRMITQKCKQLGVDESELDASSSLEQKLNTLDTLLRAKNVKEGATAKGEESRETKTVLSQDGKKLMFFTESEEKIPAMVAYYETVGLDRDAAFLAAGLERGYKDGRASGLEASFRLLGFNEAEAKAAASSGRSSAARELDEILKGGRASGLEASFRALGFSEAEAKAAAGQGRSSAARELDEILKGTKQ